VRWRCYSWCYWTLESRKQKEAASASPHAPKLPEANQSKTNRSKQQAAAGYKVIGDEDEDEDRKIED
jgi:hypothetical protein